MAYQRPFHLINLASNCLTTRSISSILSMPSMPSSISSRNIVNSPNSIMKRTYTNNPHMITPPETVKLEYSIYEPPRPREKPDSPPIIILHGLFGSKQNWKILSKAFSHRLNTRVYALDLRNHGSSPHSEIHNYEVMADDVNEFIHDHWLKEVVILGHSMGGKVGMVLALRHEKRIGQLVVVDTAPIYARLNENFKDYIEVMKEIEQLGVTTRRQADQVMRDYISDHVLRQFLLTNLKREEHEHKYSFQIPLDILKDSLETLSGFPFYAAHQAFHRKTLFVVGTRSNYVPPKVHPTIRTFFPNAVIAELDAGHWVHTEKTTEFTVIVADFLKNCKFEKNKIK